MPAKPLYYLDAYRKEFAATVTAVDGGDLFLSESAFYPRGGGQPGDSGQLEIRGHTHAVAAVARRGGDIAHPIEGDPPAVGTPVHGRINWPRRFKLMRLHTALHVLSQVVFSGFGAQVTGANIADDGSKARMDFALEGIRISDILSELESRSNALLATAAPVKTYQLPRAEAFAIPDLIRSQVNRLPESITQVRIVEIVGIDLQADGGTHVAATDQVGAIRVIGGSNKGRVNRRVEIALAN